MSFLAAESQLVRTNELQTSPDDSLRKHVRKLFQVHHRQTAVTKQRCDWREPYPYPIHITPVDAKGVAMIDDTIVALGKHLSERGIDFYYESPLPYRRVIASFEITTGNWVAFLLDLRWCRSNRHGWYENGGRFLQAAESPVGNSRPEQTRLPETA